MRTNAFLIYAGIFLTLAFASCDKLAELSSVRFDLSKDFILKGSLSSGVVLEQTIDANSNTDFLTRKSKLVDVQIEKLEYQVKTIAPNTADSLVSIEISYKKPGTTEYVVIASDQNRKLSIGSKVSLNLSAAAATGLANVFKSSDPKTDVRISATMNKVPVDISIAPIIHILLKANI